MKKLSALLLAVCMLLLITACGAGTAGTGSTVPAEVPAETTAEETSETAEPAEVPAEPEPVEETEEVSSEELEEEPDTIGLRYLQAFATSAAETADAAVDELIALNAFPTEMVKMEVSEGYLDGFTENISGFTSGVRFSPMIGSIPFVGYVFESDDPDALLTLLTDTSDPCWNICTEADETVSAVRGNLVFFLMCANDEE